MPAPRTLTFTGASDDLIEFEDSHEPGQVEEFQAYDGATFHITHGNQRLQLALTLENLSGCWHAQVGQVDETAPLPTWPVKIRQAPDTDYSVQVRIEVPADADLVQIGA